MTLSAESKKTDFITLYNPIHEKLTKFCRSITNNITDAEDLMNDTIVAAYESFEEIRDKGSFSSYIFSIASNLNKKRFRRNKFKGTYDERLFANIPDSEISHEMKTDFAIILEKLNHLPQKMRDSLILFYVSDLTIEEISNMQGSSISAVKQYLKRGREQLITRLNPKEKNSLKFLLLSL
jgi:RNA polymerase sigma-70 factor, ECF subfamily